MSNANAAATQDHYEDAPGPKKGRALAAWQDFEGELKSREDAIATMLPKNVSKDRFLNAAIAAVKQTPDLLKASPRTLFAAVTKAAQDGLLPDGREGVITAYKGEAKWNPMTYGLRKRARDLDGILIDAQVVYESDDFVWHQGDTPHIEHIPAKLGSPRGDMIGAYAIFKREDGTILHREVMDATQIETVRGQSFAKDSLMWTKFMTEAWRKTVIRRGVKSVPCSEHLEQIVRRDDDMFDFDVKPTLHLTPPPAPAITPPAAPEPGAEPAPSLPADWQDYLDRQRDEWASAKSAADKQSVSDTVTDAITGAQERAEISDEEADRIAEAWNEICERADG